MTLDLNGHSITNSGANALTVSGSTLTITDNSSGEKGALISTNGYGLGTSGAASTITLGGGITVEGSSHGAYINVSGDVLNADGVTITGQGNYGLYLAAPAGASVENCTISGKTRGVHINNTKAGTAAAKTTLAFTSNTITGSGTAAADAGFSLNTTGNYTDVTLTGGSITGGTSGFYQNTTGANTTVTVNNVSLNGRSYGAYFNTANASGTVTLDGASAVGGLYGVYNANMPGTASLTLDGITAKGEVAALYTESGKTTVLSDETNTHFSGLNATAGNGTVTYPGAYIGFKENGTDESTGYKSWSMTDDTDELPVAGEKVSVTVGGTETKYATFADAFAAADDNGGTIKLLEDVTEVVGTAFTVPEGKEITIDLNGKTFKAIVTATKVMDLFTNNGTLNFTDNSVQSRTDAGEDDRGAVDGAGRLLLENGNNLQHVLVRNNTGASRVSVERVTLEVGGTNNGIAIQLGTGSLLEHVTDATIIAPRYGIYDGSKYNQNNTGASVGDLTNSVIKVTDTVGNSGNTHEANNPVAIYLNDRNRTTSIGNITNCYIQSDFFGVVLFVGKSGNISGTDIYTKKYPALELYVTEGGNITGGYFKANENKPGYTSAYVIMIGGGSKIGSITDMEIVGADGIVMGDGVSIESIQSCKITAQNWASGASSEGQGIGTNGDITIRGAGVEVDGDTRTVAIYDCDIDAYLSAVTIDGADITGDILDCTFDSEIGTGFSITIGDGTTQMTGIFDSCTMTGRSGLWFRGSIGGIKNCTLTSTATEPDILANSYALSVWNGVITGPIENTAMTGYNDPFRLQYEVGSSANTNPDEADFVFTDCTFERLDEGGYKYNTKGTSLTLGGTGPVTGEEYHSAIHLRADSTVNLEKVSPMSEPFNLGYDYDGTATNNPLAKKLTIQSDESIEGGVTLTRAEDYKGQMFHVQNGTLELKDITLRGNSDAQDTMIYVSNYGSEYCLIVGDGAVLTGNTNTSSSGGAIRCKGDLVIDGGTISNNSARQSGGGVDFSGSGTLTINGGTITGNSCANGASGNGGGVYISGSATAVKMSGSPVITGNTKAGKANNLHIHNTPIEFTGELGENAEIGVITFNKPAESSPVQISTADILLRRARVLQLRRRGLRRLREHHGALSPARHRL